MGSATAPLSFVAFSFLIMALALLAAVSLITHELRQH